MFEGGREGKAATAEGLSDAGGDARALGDDSAAGVAVAQAARRSAAQMKAAGGAQERVTLTP